MTSRAEECVHNVAAVELADGKEIDSGGQHAEPGGPANGMEPYDGIGAAREENRRCQLKKQGFAELQTLPYGFSENQLRGLLESHDQGGNDEDEAPQRPGNSHVEELAAIGEERLDLDHGPERPERVERGWPGNHIGKGRFDSVVAASKIVSHLVCQQDYQDREGERKAAQQIHGIGQDSGESPCEFTLALTDKLNMPYEAGRYAGDECAQK